MQPKTLQITSVFAAFVISIFASPTVNENSAVLEDRSMYCGPKGCAENGGSSHCWDIGCDGNCLTAGYCGGSSCNTHFNNCRGTIEHDIASKAGLLIEHANGTIESLDGAEEHVAAVLESMRKK